MCRLQIRSEPKTAARPEVSPYRGGSPYLPLWWGDASGGAAIQHMPPVLCPPHQPSSHRIHSDVLSFLRKLRFVAQPMLKEVRLPLDPTVCCLIPLPVCYCSLDAAVQIERRNQMHMIGHDQHQPDKPTSDVFVVTHAVEDTSGDIAMKERFPTSFLAVYRYKMASTLYDPGRDFMGQLAPLG